MRAGDGSPGLSSQGLAGPAQVRGAFGWHGREAKRRWRVLLTRLCHCGPGYVTHRIDSTEALTSCRAPIHRRKSGVPVQSARAAPRPRQHSASGTLMTVRTAGLSPAASKTGWLLSTVSAFLTDTSPRLHTSQVRSSSFLCVLRAHLQESVFHKI